MFSDKEMYLPPAVSPTPEFHFAVLVVEREPRDVDFAGRLEDPRRNVRATTVVGDHHVRGVSPVKGFVSALVVNYVRIKSLFNFIVRRFKK